MIRALIGTILIGSGLTLYLAVCSGKSTVERPEADTIKVVPTKIKKKFPNTIGDIRFSQDGKLLAVGLHNGTIKLLNTSNWQSARTLRVNERSIYSIAFSPDGTLLTSASSYGAIKLWNPKIGQQVRSLLSSGDPSYLSVAFSPNGNMLAVGDKEGKIRLWDTSSWQMVRTLDEALYMGREVSYSPIWELMYSADGRFFASTGGDGLSRVYDTTTWKTLPWGRKKRCQSISFSPNGRYFVASSDVEPITIWDVKTGERLPVELDETQEAGPVAFSPNNQWLGTGGPEDIQIWETKTWKLIQKSPYFDWVRCLNFSSDSQSLVVGFNQGQLGEIQIRSDVPLD
jgi:WD40 repeat protein